MHHLKTGRMVPRPKSEIVTHAYGGSSDFQLPKISNRLLIGAHADGRITDCGKDGY